MTCLCPDAIARPSDLCPVHGSVPLAGDDEYWLWFDDDRDPDDGDWVGPWVAAFIVVGTVVAIAAALLAPAKLIGDLLHKDKNNG